MNRVFGVVIVTTIGVVSSRADCRARGGDSFASFTTESKKKDLPTRNCLAKAKRSTVEGEVPHNLKKTKVVDVTTSVATR